MALKTAHSAPVQCRADNRREVVPICSLLSFNTAMLFVSFLNLPNFFFFLLFPSFFSFKQCDKITSRLVHELLKRNFVGMPKCRTARKWQSEQFVEMCLSVQKHCRSLAWQLWEPLLASSFSCFHMLGFLNWCDDYKYYSFPIIILNNLLYYKSAQMRW